MWPCSGRSPRDHFHAGHIPFIHLPEKVVRMGFGRGGQSAAEAQTVDVRIIRIVTRPELLFDFGHAGLMVAVHQDALVLHGAARFISEIDRINVFRPFGSMALNGRTS